MGAAEVDAQFTINAALKHRVIPTKCGHKKKLSLPYSQLMSTLILF